MDFREATDRLFNRVDHARLAKELGVSIASIRQARLRNTSAAHRSPPNDWRTAVLHLAEQEEQRHKELAQRLREEIAGNGDANCMGKVPFNQIVKRIS